MTKDTRQLTCIICPTGCQLDITLPQNYTEETKHTFEASSFIVTGNTCPRGIAYACKELTTPERTLTCTVAVSGGKRPLVPAKTSGEIPKEKLFDCMQIIKRLTVNAPIKIGNVLLHDILGTGQDIIACESVD